VASLEGFEPTTRCLEESPNLQAENSYLFDDKTNCLDNLFQGYKLTCKAEGKSQKTIRIATTATKVFKDFLVEEGLSTDVTQIDSKIIRRYILYLQQVKLFRDHPCNKPIDRKLTGHTINCYLRTLRTFWNWLYSEELIQSNPFAKIKIPKAPKKLIPTFSNNQIQDLLAAIDTSTPVGYRDWTILITLLDTGLRASELVGLTLDYVWIEDGLLKVLGKGNKERLVPIGATVQKAMWRYIGLHPYDWTDRVRRVWQGISLFS